MAAAAAPPAPQAVAPGQWFDWPGIPQGSTGWSEQDETTTNAVVAVQAGTAVDFQTVLPMKQTDVVADWLACFQINQSYTAGTSALTPSAYAPFNAIGSVKLDIQNQYASIDIPTGGIDWYIFNLIRPYRGPEVQAGTNLYANPSGSPVGGTATGYMTTALAQPNLIAPAQWSPASTVTNLILRIPGSQWFDVYYDLAVDGTPTAQPHPALVSPQYMAGTSRVITAKVRMNQATGTALDTAPVNIGAGSGAYASSNASLRLRRKAIYASGNPAVLPPAFPWQYRWKSQQIGIGALTQKDLIIPPDCGQVLSIFVRLWDPAAASGLGAPIGLQNLTRARLEFGSGLVRFDAQTVGGTTAGQLLQKQWLESHDALLPPGVFAFDLALDEFGRMSNKRALNVLTTSGIQVHMEFSGTQSPSSYAVLGVESLVYVS